MNTRICFGVAAMMFLSGLSMAGVVFHLSSPSEGLVTIGYTASADVGVRGLALNVELSGNATAVYTDILSVHPVFTAYIDYLFSHPEGNLGDGHPFANPDNAGSVDVPASVFSICMGVFDETGNQMFAPDVIDNLITFRIQDGGAGFSTVTLSQDLLRGGAVGDNIGVVTMPQPLNVTIPEPCTFLSLGLGGVMVWRRRRLG